MCIEAFDEFSAQLQALGTHIYIHTYIYTHILVYAFRHSYQSHLRFQCLSLSWEFVGRLLTTIDRSAFDDLAQIHRFTASFLRLQHRCSQFIGNTLLVDDYLLLILLLLLLALLLFLLPHEKKEQSSSSQWGLLVYDCVIVKQN